jgi:hypothetical protein
MTFTVYATEEPSDALDRAASFLASDRVRHNLVLTILQDRLETPTPGRYWLAEDGDVVHGVALQSSTNFIATDTDAG